ncbi:carbohydrate ABC transporter permease [Cellulomonas bogoriensis]|uniref:carbohydrate ABC transporter permease n=1 Tax=Cellulomonas bogoriensis TaxID=301388 RepID=UPI000B1E79B6|nr:sugar ABC transporter permease [Cellulomonas bogoriensis]
MGRRGEIAFFLTPAILLYVVFVIYPITRAGQYSFYRWNGLQDLTDFIGFQNYREAITNSVFQGALMNNLTIIIASLVVQLPIGLGIALLLNRKLKGRGALRTIIFIPYVLAEVVAGVMWTLILTPRGAANATLQNLGLENLQQLWLADPDIALWTLFGVLTWKYVGFAIILFLAGLQGVPEELHEAAALDGASWWQIQRRIVIPMIGPTIRIWAFLSMIGSIQLFDLVWIMTGGGPANSTQTMATYLIGQGFERFRFGYGSAVAVIMFSFSLILALFYQRFVLARDVQDPVSGRKG